MRISVALEEFHRVLRPDGLLLLTVPAYRFLWSEHDEALMHRRRYVASELHMKLTRAGFRVLKRTYAVFFMFFPIVFYRLFRGLVPEESLLTQGFARVAAGPSQQFPYRLAEIGGLDGRSDQLALGYFNCNPRTKDNGGEDQGKR